MILANRRSERTVLRKTYVVLGLLFALFILSPEEAFAHDLRFDSDINEDGVINLSNPEGIKSTIIQDAINDWNQKVLTDPLFTGPIIVDVTGTALYTEVRVNNVGGQDANYFARIQFYTQPDQLQISARFDDLSAAKEGSVIRHELGHTRGHAHHDASFCDVSLMPELRTCADAGVPRITEVGPHDVADEGTLWTGPKATHPVPHKCWYKTSSDDANGDDLCDHFGPPPTDTDQVVPQGLPNVLEKPMQPPSPPDKLVQ